MAHRHVPRLDVSGRYSDPGFLNAWLFGSVLLQHMANGLPMTENGRDRVIYEMYAHPFDDDWQRLRSPFWELDQVDIPVLSIELGASRSASARQFRGIPSG